MHTQILGDMRSATKKELILSLSLLLALGSPKQIMHSERVSVMNTWKLIQVNKTNLIQSVQSQTT